MKNLKHPMLLTALVLLLAWSGYLISATTFSWSGPQATGTLTYKKAVMEDVKLTGITTNEGSMTIGTNLTVSGTSTLTGDVTASADVDISSNVVVGGTMSVTGKTDLIGAVDITGDAAVQGALTVTNNATITSNLTFQSRFPIAGPDATTLLVIESGTNILDAAGVVTQVFTTAFAAAPQVILTYNTTETTGTNLVASSSASNEFVAAGASSEGFYWLAIGTK